MNKYISLLSLILYPASLYFLFRENSPANQELFLCMILQLLAYSFIVITASRAGIIIISIVFLIQSPLVFGWGILVAMFSGWGDGASRGAGLSDVFPWFVAGIALFLIGLCSLIKIGKLINWAKKISV